MRHRLRNLAAAEVAADVEEDLGTGGQLGELVLAGPECASPSAPSSAALSPSPNPSTTESK